MTASLVTRCATNGKHHTTTRGVRHTSKDAHPPHRSEVVVFLFSRSWALSLHLDLLMGMVIAQQNRETGWSAGLTNPYRPKRRQTRWLSSRRSTVLRTRASGP